MKKLFPRKVPKTTEFTSSLQDDLFFAQEEIRTSLAHVEALKEAGVLDDKEASDIKKALLGAGKELETGDFRFDASANALHPNIEKYVMEKCGLSGGKLHTARSRNDQTVASIRLECREQMTDVQEKLLTLLEVMLKKAWKFSDVVMPSYSHLQHSQIVTFGHYLSAYTDALLRDYERLNRCYDGCNKNTMGCASGGGSSFEIDRLLTTEALGFGGMIENSLDAVSSRDFMLETASALSILLNNLSRLAGDLIAFSSYEFRMVDVADELCTASFAMPQKKNPVVLELIRSHAGRAAGNLQAMLGMLKGLATGYNRDMHECSPLMFATFELAEDSVEMITKAIDTLKVNDQRMLELCDRNYAASYDLAEMLIRQGIPFQNAHAVVGTVMKECLKTGKKLSDIEPSFIESIILRQLKFETKIDQGELKNATIPEQAVAKRATKGCPNPKEVKRMIANREATVTKEQKELRKRKAILNKTLSALQ